MVCAAHKTQQRPRPAAAGGPGPQPLAAALALLMAVAVLPQAAAVKPVGDGAWVQGLATHFGGAQDSMDPSSTSFGTKEGSCGYGVIPKDKFPYFSTAALAPSNSFYQADELHGCGQCFQIQCADSRSGVCKKDAAGKPLSVLVMITDSCPECESDHLDVQSLAFGKLSDPGVGRIDIQYRRVECAVPEDMKVSVMDYAGPGGWLRLAIDQAGGRAAVASVAVQGADGGDWKPLDHSWGATWELSSAPRPPLSFKIVGDAGEEVTAINVIKQAGGISGGADGPRAAFATAAQFAITDPALGVEPKVTAFDGPDAANGDPMVVTSSTPGASSDSSSTAAAGSTALAAAGAPASEQSISSANGGGSCGDTPTPDGHSCAQQKEWGKCSESFIRDNGYCKSTCGACGGSSGSTNNSAQQKQSNGGSATDGAQQKQASGGSANGAAQQKQASGGSTNGGAQQKQASGGSANGGAQQKQQKQQGNSGRKMLLRR